MAAGDGVYITLNDLKTYGLNGDTSATPDDGMLSQSIYWAEQKWNATCGIQFNTQSFTRVQAFTPFVDYNGWLHLFAREAGPVTAVTAVRYRRLPTGDTGYTDVTISSDNLLLPLATDPMRPDGCHVQVYIGPSLLGYATNQLLVQWSYSGGYASIPNSLKSIIVRLAWWRYKLREAPLGRIVTGAGGLGMMEIPLAMPADILADSMLWRPNYS